MKIFFVLFTTALLVSGVMLIFNITAIDIINLFKRPVKNRYIDKKTSLASIVKHYKGKKGFFVVQEILSVYDLMKETRREKQFRSLLIQACLLAVVGCLIGLLINNLIVAPFLAIVLFMIPLWRMKIYHNKYQKYVAAQLESCVSLITTAYTRNDNISAAVTENLTNIDDIIRPYFEEFVAEYKINANMESCIRGLQKKINNSIFREWCDSLIKTYRNSDIKENLVLIAQKFATVREVQDDLDAEMGSAVTEYVLMIITLIGCYPLVYLLNRDWFSAYSTTPGKICVALSVFAIAYAVGKLISLLSPIKFER